MSGGGAWCDAHSTPPRCAPDEQRLTTTTSCSPSERERARGGWAHVFSAGAVRARDIGPLLRGASSAVDDPPRRDDATAASVGGAAEGRSDPPPALVRNGCAGPRGSASALFHPAIFSNTHGQSAPSSEEGHNLNIGVDYMPFKSNCIIHFFGW